MRSCFNTALIGMTCFVLTTWAAFDVFAKEVADPSKPVLSEETAARPEVTQEEIARAREIFANYKISAFKKRKIYEALKVLGHATEDLEIPDFLLRKNTIRAVGNYQEAIGVKPTGYLKKYQIRLLFRMTQPSPSQEAENVAQQGTSAKSAFFDLRLDCAEKRETYRALYALGFAKRRTAFPDFLSDETLIAAVSAYQESVDAEPTGFLDKKQVDRLRRKAGKSYLWEHRGCDPDQLLFPLEEWFAAGYSQSDKKDVFDKLKERGFLEGDRLSDSLTDTDNKDAVRRLQASIGAEQTGYLTSRQADVILAGWVKLDPREQWLSLKISSAQRRDLYRSLYSQGLARSVVPAIDFAYDMNLQETVRLFQSENGYHVTGYLTKAQIAVLLSREIKLTPFEQEAELLKKYGSLNIWKLLEDFAKQEHSEVPSFRRAIVAQIQKGLNLPDHGYLTDELFARMKTISLEPVPGRNMPPSYADNVEEKPQVKDWRRWDNDEYGHCLIATEALVSEGFTGSVRLPNISFYRERSWPENSLNMDLDLVNWDLKKPAKLQIGGENFFIGISEEGPKLVTLRGTEAAEKVKYNQLINKLIQSNGFELSYTSVFGEEVVASVSALGFTRQLKDILTTCGP